MYLKALTELSGVSGNEDCVRAFVLEHIKSQADEIIVDNIGNLIALKKGTGESNKKVMISAHMDEVGLIISKITEDGFLKFKSVGGIDPRVLISKKVRIGENKISGVLGAKAIHLQKKSERESVPEEKDLYIDIGAKDKEDAEKHVSLGDFCAFDSAFTEFGDGLVKAKALDDRVGCAIMMELLKDAAFAFDVYFAFTVQEEVGCRGARVATNRINPDIAIVLEGTTCSDVHGSKEKDYSTQIGKGPALSIIDRSTYYDKDLVNAIYTFAKAHKIPVQFKKTASGGNDAAVIHLSKGGVKTAAISVPARYIHSASSVIAKTDYEAMKKLILAVLREGIFDA